jgi:Protein of unknown function (DUF2934)
MTTKGNEKRATKGEKVKLAITNANEQMRRVQEAVAHRAYAIFESRGSGSWHELQDWGQAESELVRPLNCGRRWAIGFGSGLTPGLLSGERSKSGSRLARSQSAGSRELIRMSRA